MNKLTNINNRSLWEFRDFFRKFHDKDFKRVLLNAKLRNEQVIKVTINIKNLFYDDKISFIDKVSDFEIPLSRISTIWLVSKPLESIEIPYSKQNKYTTFDKNTIFVVNYKQMTIEELFGLSDGEIIDSLKEKFNNHKSQFMLEKDYRQSYQVLKNNFRIHDTIDNIIPQLYVQNVMEYGLNKILNVYEQTIEIKDIVNRLNKSENKYLILQMVCNTLIYHIKFSKSEGNVKNPVNDSITVFDEIIKLSKLYEYGNLFNLLLNKNNIKDAKKF